MKGFMAKSIWLGGMAAGLLAIAGCACGPCGVGHNQCQYTYDDLVDPCYPQRYIYEARALTREPLETQAHNGLVLEHTLWNHHFEAGTDKLTPGGKMLIDRWMRRRPAANPDIFLQTAMDLPEPPAKPNGGGTDAVVHEDKDESCAARRNKLNDARRKAVEKYLADCYPSASINVIVHNAAMPGMHSGEAGRALAVVQAAAGTTVNSATAERNRAERAGYQDGSDGSRSEGKSEKSSDGKEGEKK